MNACERFLADLDERGAAAVASAHADTCPRCARALAAAREIESLLAPAPAAFAPSGFTDRVIARVRGEAPARAATPVAAADPMPAWVRLAAEPHIAAALVLAALLIAQSARLATLGRSAFAAFAAQVAAGGASWSAGPVARAFADVTGSDTVRLALLSSVVALTALLAIPLYRWSERLVGARGR